MPSPALDLSALIEALSRRDAYPHAADTIEVHQTHISVVFLAGPFAYKTKKPVNLGFLDFSTLEKRKHFCEEEVRLNRRLAPLVYLSVVPITTDPEAQARDSVRVNGSGPVVEWAVQMQRLSSEATLESRLERAEVTPEQIRVLAQRIAAFHRQAEANERIASFGRFAVVASNARENLKQAEPLVGVTVSPLVFERVRGLTEDHLARQHDRIETRAERGVPCDTHGDLHLDHVYLFPEQAPPDDLVIIDCIEFADRFRYADPVADMAFLAMDLAFHGRRDLERVFADAYFAAAEDTPLTSGPSPPEGRGEPSEGRPLLPFYSAYRSVVRAKVDGMELGEKEIDPQERSQAEERARAHWLLALGDLEEPARRPALVLLAGLPGSGKSTLARFLADTAGFCVLRSDLIRKELAASNVGRISNPAHTEGQVGPISNPAHSQVGPISNPAHTEGDVGRISNPAHTEGEGGRISNPAHDPDIYSEAWTERTYAELLRRAEELLWQGGRVAIDANLRDDQRRRPFFNAARRWGVPIVFIQCVASDDATRDRLQARHGDVSDADWRIFQQLKQTWQPVEESWLRLVHVLDTSGPLPDNEQKLQTILRQEGLIAS